MRHDDVQEGSYDDDEVKVVPGVLHILAETKSGKLDDKFKGKDSCEDEVHDVKELCVHLRLKIKQFVINFRLGLCLCEYCLRYCFFSI